MDEPQVILDEPKKKPEPRPRARGSLLFPILLVTAGVIFLLDNLGYLDQSAWDTVVRLWPLLLIVAGLDGLWKREGAAGAALGIGVGVVLLLANFGYLSMNPWATFLRLWPLFLIAIGLDVLVGRRSLAGQVIAFFLMLAILAGAFYFFGEGIRPGGTAVQGAQVSQALETVNSAEVVVQAGAGEMRIGALDASGDLIRGTVPEDPRQQVSQEYRVEGDRAIYSLRTSGAAGIVTGRTYTWDLGLNPSVPMDLQFDLGAGDMELNLEALTVDSLKVDLGVGEVQVRLPDAGQYDASVSAAIGSIRIHAPEGLGVRIQEDAALVSVNVPDGYQRDGDTYTSPGYASAAQRVDLDVNLAIGSINLEQP